jgi:Integral membrane protein (intg_mem_TP0381)
MTLFGPIHLMLLAGIVALVALLAWACRTGGLPSRPVRITLGLVLALNELIWWVFRYSHEGFHFPRNLPLQLCDVAVWMTVVACLTLKPWVVELALRMAELWRGSRYWYLAGSLRCVPARCGVPTEACLVTPRCSVLSTRYSTPTICTSVQGRKVLPCWMHLVHGRFIWCKRRGWRCCCISCCGCGRGTRLRPMN